MYVIAVPEREGRRLVQKKYLRNNGWKLSSLVKHIRLQNKLEENHTRHIIIKLLKTRGKEKKPWKQPEKITHYTEPRRQWKNIFKVLKEKSLLTENCTSSENILQEWWGNKDILRGRKLRKFIASRPSLKEMIKEVLQAKGKWFKRENWNTGNEGRPNTFG